MIRAILTGLGAALLAVLAPLSVSAQIVTTGLQYNWDADDPGATPSSVWEFSTFGVANAAENWTMNSSPPKLADYGSVVSATTIDNAYTFGGFQYGTTSDQNGSANREAFNPTESTVDNPNATFEFWIKPDSLTNGKQVIFETGGGTRGWGLTLWDDELRTSLKTADGNGDPVPGNIIAHTLTAPDIADFLQVVVTMDDSDDGFAMYVNPLGELAPDTAKASGTWAGDNWQGSSDSALGGIHGFNESNGFGAGSENNQGTLWEPSSFSGFEGQIGIVRVYDVELSGADVATNYAAVAVPEPSSLLLAGLGACGLAVLVWRRRRLRSGARVG